MAIILKVWGNLYNKDTNPDGVINVGVAENYLPQKELTEWLNENVKFSPVDLTYGDSLAGGKRLRNNLANLYNTRLSPLTPLDPDNILVSSGVSSVIDQLAWVLADPGDGVLLGKPFYGGFQKDMYARARVKTVAVSLKDVEDPLGVEAVARFEEELLASEKRGTKIRAIILCNPHNPLGRCYTLEALNAYMRLCAKYSIHLISDEIYAFTLYPPTDASSAPPFHSILSIPPLMDPEYIHVAYGASKDFVMNGLRLGFLYTTNPRVKAAYSDIAFFTRPASVAEVMWSTVLENETYLDGYFKKNSALCARGRDIVTAWLEEHNVPYVKNTYAGFFIWIDVRKWLPTGKDSKTGKELTPVEQERKLTMRMVEGGVYLATGEFFGGEEPGYYRLSFANEPDELRLALERLGEALWGQHGNGEVETLVDGVRKVELGGMQLEG
ncbi:putative aminotransferase [Ascobolus immersus RN42]|uniref:Putative aminotransferase n=1 Tax=Ascobolus immersus RN42 TaxID=1160509 RepID=A0A3N4HS80_ASCIM|nr:putative aminotransferase [Ascobolus immersus RN42]